MFIVHLLCYNKGVRERHTAIPLKRQPTGKKEDKEMTGNIGVKNRYTGAYRITATDAAQNGSAIFGKGTCEKIKESAATAICTAILALRKASELKKEVSAIVVEVSESLADKTAREGLFGEDKDKGYSGTDVEYIPENAAELKYFNYDMAGFDNAQTRRYIAEAQRRARCGEKRENTGVLRVFNGF